MTEQLELFPPRYRVSIIWGPPYPVPRFEYIIKPVTPVKKVGKIRKLFQIFYSGV